MRSFEEIIKDCQDNKYNKNIFNKHFNELLQTKEVKKMINKLQNSNVLYCFHSKFNTDKEIIKNSIIWALNLNLPNWEKEIYNLNFHYIDIKRKARDLLLSDLSRADRIKYCNFQIISKYKKEYPKNTFLDDNMILNEIIQKYKKEHPEYASLEDNMILNKIGYSMLEILSLDAQNSSDDNLSSTFIDMQKSDDNVEENAEYSELDELENHLNKIGIKEPRDIFIIAFICRSENNFKNLQDILDKLCEYSQKTNIKGIEPKKIKEIENIIKFCEKRDPKYIGEKISTRINPSIYAELINYLININENNEIKVSKMQLKKLILDFNKIRNYMSFLFNSDDIKDKNLFIKKSNIGSVSSYEKESRRIIDIFKPQGNFLELKKELKEYKPCEFLKIYDIHTVPNIIINFVLLNIFQKSKLNNIKIADLTKELFLKNKKINDNHIKTFRKYTLLPRLKELKEYGFITINNDKYSLNAKFLDGVQKKALKYVVPFFCGIYPFSSIGHFLANRLEIKDLFRFEIYNIANILDDCITYDLLYSINHNIEPYIKLRNKDSYKKIKPIELFLEKEKSLLKVKTVADESYLCDIKEIILDKSHKNPIFSEIYSFYYKIFEDAIKIYKKYHDEKETKKQILSEYSDTYNLILDSSDLDTLFFEKQQKTQQSILQIISNIENIENVSIPLTTLELRWLKTIMQDARFDLFVSEDEKYSLENLVEDVTPFDLSAFKVYDNKTKTYKSINTFEIPNGVDRNSLKKKLKEFNSVLYSIQNNSFDFNCKKA